MVIPKWLLVIALLASGSEHVTEREGMVKEMSTEIQLTLTNELPEQLRQNLTLSNLMAKQTSQDQFVLFLPAFLLTPS